MRFGHIELFVKDPVASRYFYTDVLGFKLEDEQGPPGQPPRFIWLSHGRTEILLRPGQPQEAVEFHKATTNFVLYTNDVGATALELQERGLVFRGEDGPGCLTFTDPDGHWFQLVNPGDDHSS
jgi:catechol 2,3-dioxygenase-like lactoylglutathione lyase family enzyme